MYHQGTIEENEFERLKDVLDEVDVRANRKIKFE
jgi:hypothetical protein